MARQQKSDFLHDQLIIEYFKAMREEINLRIRNHTTLVTAKVITAGGILAFMLKEGANLNLTVSVFGVLLVPIVAMLYDVLISNNIRNINRMGSFIRDSIEPYAPDDRLWEGEYAQKDVKHRCYRLVDIITLSSLTFGTIIVAMLLLWHMDERTSFYLLWPFVVLAWGFTTYHMKECFLHFLPSTTKTSSHRADSHSNEKNAEQIA